LPAQHLPGKAEVPTASIDRVREGEVAMAEKILVVEDEYEIRNYLKMVLEDGGYRVDAAATAAQAQELLHGERYDLVIADWWLSDGTGMVIVDEAAELGSKTVVLSGYVSELLGEKARHTLLKKPISPRDLVSAVQRAVANPA
jgi:DNA-binding response OmpR family regulator